MSLIAAVAFQLFTGGRWAMPIAAWLSHVFLLLFARGGRAAPRLLVTALTWYAIAFACVVWAAPLLAAVAEPTRPAATLTSPAPRWMPRPWILAEGGAAIHSARPPSFVERHRTALTLLGIEAAGTLLASSGYIAEAIDQEPKKGAEFTGGTYMGLGGVGAAFGFIIAIDPDRKPGDLPGYLVAVAGLIALGAYDLDQAKGSPSSSEIFRDNMIGINLVIASTAATKWLVGRRAREAHRTR